jgi:hypothetical protein
MNLLRQFFLNRLLEPVKEDVKSLAINFENDSLKKILLSKPSYNHNAEDFVYYYFEDQHKKPYEGFGTIVDIVNQFEEEGPVLYIIKKEDDGRFINLPTFCILQAGRS